MDSRGGNSSDVMMIWSPPGQKRPKTAFCSGGFVSDFYREDNHGNRPPGVSRASDPS
jgi:hypothetical protein